MRARSSSMVMSCSENAVIIALIDVLVLARACSSWPRLQVRQPAAQVRDGRGVVGVAAEHLRDQHGLVLDDLVEGPGPGGLGPPRESWRL